MNMEIKSIIKKRFKELLLIVVISSLAVLLALGLLMAVLNRGLSV